MGNNHMSTSSEIIILQNIQTQINEEILSNYDQIASKCKRNKDKFTIASHISSYILFILCICAGWQCKFGTEYRQKSTVYSRFANQNSAMRQRLNKLMYFGK